ncbi:MAG: sodium-dependent transporter [Candidatus Rariloculaceae bacterium]
MVDLAAEKRTSLHGHWSSRFAFILAVAGSAVGLGNIWKFPYIAGVNGGGAFVLVYLLCVFIIGLPIMMAEILMGRRGRRNPIATMRLLGEEEGGSRRWAIVGAVGVIAGFLILSYYSVIAGWAIAYIFQGISGAFTSIDTEGVGAIFSSISGSWALTGFWHTLFMVMTTVVVSKGVEQGLERAVRVLMPALLTLLLVLLFYSVIAGDFAAGLRFMFEPKFGDLTQAGVLSALGHAFFTLSVGMGAVMAYGAYLPSETSIVRISIAVVSADTVIAILAGLVIFPIVFANGLDPAAGPGLIFQSLPLAFGQLPGGIIIAGLFFLLLTFAAWTSAISLMEPAVAWLIEVHKLSRGKAAVFVGGTIWLLGFLSVFSFGLLEDFQPFGRTLFDNLDFLTSNIMLPLGGLLIVFFAGWVMRSNSSADELDTEAGMSYLAWRFAARYIAPVAVVVIFLNAIGLL